MLSLWYMNITGQHYYLLESTDVRKEEKQKSEDLKDSTNSYIPGLA